MHFSLQHTTNLFVNTAKKDFLLKVISKPVRNIENCVPFASYSSQALQDLKHQHPLHPAAPFLGSCVPFPSTPPVKLPRKPQHNSACIIYPSC